MKIAIYGKTFTDDFIPTIQGLFLKLKNYKSEIIVFEPFYEFLLKKIRLRRIKIPLLKTFNEHKDICKKTDFLITIGGDGTLLETVTLVGNFEIPILAINTGRLGFLSNISTKEEIDSAIDKIIKRDSQNIKIDRRTLLRVETKEKIFGKDNFALNEFTIQKYDSSSMITVHVSINNKYLNSYWGDGLIISTSTGSTAYSLSCGGPIILPLLNIFIITPIAPHNLNVRPLIVPDNSIIKIRVEGRSKKFIATLDHRSCIIDSAYELFIKKEKFKINLLKTDEQDFFATIRNKLMWGVDKRNY